MQDIGSLPNLVTVAQFRQLPEGGEVVYELHHGEVVALTRPRARHWKLQHRLLSLLGPILRSFGVVRIEYPYRPVPEFDLRAADVAVVSRARWDAVDPEDNLHGAPELVIEVKSPPNTPRQLQELAALTLANGAIEFWIVDPEKKSLVVISREGGSTSYSEGTTVPLFMGGEVTVDEIFA